MPAGPGLNVLRWAACLCCLSFLWLFALPGLTTCALANEPQSKRVLIIHSYGKSFLPWAEYATGIRAELVRQSPSALSIEDYPLFTAASVDGISEGPFAVYLQSLYARQPPALIVTMGAPAAIFVQKHRAALFPATPALFAAVDNRFIQRAELTDNDAAVPVAIELPPLFQNILQVLPATKRIAVMMGASPQAVRWLEPMRNELAAFGDKVEITFHYNEPLQELLNLAATLPPDSAVFWTQLLVDGAGVVYEGDDALKQMRLVTSAPIFSYDDTFFKGETVGGPMLSRAEVTRETAAMAVRLLAGEKPSAIRPAPITFAAARFDWRELQRWNIDEGRLPQGSEVYFREPTVWQRYRLPFLAIGAAFLVQGWLITTLLYERWARRRADSELRQRMSELARINRHSTAGALSSSIAHEINQPLATILANAETATLMLERASPDLDEIRHILQDIQRDNHRASEIIRRLRDMVRQMPFEQKIINLNDVVKEVVAMISAAAEQRNVQIQCLFDAPQILVKGDAVQLQQVVMNLLVNAIDAVTQEHGARSVVVRAELADGKAQLSVNDTGPGIPRGKREEIFDAFFTTKTGGMGMGLAIVRTIVRAHSGLIWAEDAAGGGAVFRVTLPLAPAPEA